MTEQTSQTAQFVVTPTRTRGQGFYLVLLLAVAAATRFAWMHLAPTSISADLRDWQLVASGLAVGFNAYQHSHLLNWPPFWMETLYACMRVSNRFGWDIISCIRAVLILADLAVLASLFGLLRLLHRQTSHARLLLFGYCLNPLLILLTVQHGNFDAFAELWIVLMLVCLIRFRRRREVADYLLAASCLGMGAFTKTFPLILWPLLVPGARRVSAARWLAAGLVLGPIVLSLMPLYVLNPAEISRNVIEYRSFGPSFGVMGLLTLLHANTLAADYSNAFVPVFLIALAAIAARLWRRDLREDRDVVLLAAPILLGSFLLGPGYGPQYWFWIVPLFVVVYGQFKRLRIVLLIGGAVVVATNVFEYAIIPSLGQFWIEWHPSAVSLQEYGEKLLNSDLAQAKLRLAMSLASIVTLFAGIWTLWRRKEAPKSKQSATP